MAKYIRTKDKIYEIESDYLNNKGVRVGYNVVGQEEVVLIGNNNIIQADSIDELCDYFLIDKNDIEHYEPTTLLIFDDYDDFRYSMFGYEFASGYGCIKTDRGLIYVAKFNWEDEELELI